MNPPTRRTALAAATAFVGALAVAYLVGGAGSASAPAAPPGERAVRLDVAPPTSGAPAIGKAASIPALAKHKDPSPPPPAATPTATTPQSPRSAPNQAPATPAPVAPAPVAPAPVVPRPPVVHVPAPAPPPPPSVQFDDSG